MSDDDAKGLDEVFANLEKAAITEYRRGRTARADLIHSAIWAMHCLTAENARKDAKIEWLTPKPMTLVDVANVLNGRRYKGHRWYVNESRTHVCTITNEYVYHEPEATYIAQGLLRDAKIIEGTEP